MRLDLWNSKNIFSFEVVMFIVSAALVYFFRLFGDHMNTFGSVITTVSGLIAVAAGVYALKHLGLKSLHGKSILMLTVANFIWVIADLSWVTVNGLAVVSFSDILWIIGYPLFFFGILFGIQAFVGNIFKSKMRVVAAAVLILLFGVIYFSVFHLEWNPSKSDVENLVSVGYVLGDMFLIMPLIMLICISFGEVFSFSWFIIGISMLLTLIDDMAYNFNPDGHVTGSPIDLIRFSAYLLMAIAFIFVKRSENETSITSGIVGNSACAVPENAASPEQKPSASINPDSAKSVHMKSSRMKTVSRKKKTASRKAGSSRK